MKKYLPAFLLIIFLSVTILSVPKTNYTNCTKKEHFVTAQPLEVNNLQLKYATTYNRVGMQRELFVYENYKTVADLYKFLQFGKLREVTEPQTDYGALFEIWDYYMEEYVIGLYQETPKYKQNGENAINSNFSFVIYTMLEGEPEFGNDSKHLLYDINNEKWYVFSEKQYNNVLEVLNTSEKKTLYAEYA